MKKLKKDTKSLYNLQVKYQRTLIIRIIYVYIFVEYQQNNSFKGKKAIILFFKAIPNIISAYHNEL